MISIHTPCVGGDLLQVVGIQTADVMGLSRNVQSENTQNL